MKTRQTTIALLAIVALAFLLSNAATATTLTFFSSVLPTITATHTRTPEVRAQSTETPTATLPLPTNTPVPTNTQPPPPPTVTPAATSTPEHDETSPFVLPVTGGM